MHFATRSDRDPATNWSPSREAGLLSRRRIVALALCSQGLMIALAWIGSRALGLDTAWGHPVRDAGIGLAAAAALAASNYLLIAHAPPGWIASGLRAVLDDVLVPLFGRLDASSVIVLGALAGLSEEWLFRGVVQPLVGLPAASVAFGLVHLGGRVMLPFAIWAMAMGMLLGGLALATGGLIAPIVAHGVYDMLALEYIRRTRPGRRGVHYE
jgi:membrane protease YdiL (CAAX protease family)